MLKTKYSNTPSKIKQKPKDRNEVVHVAHLVKDEMMNTHFVYKFDHNNQMQC